MSANFLPKEHIDALLTAAFAWTQDPKGFRYRAVGTYDLEYLTRDNADAVGAMLWRTNWEVTEGWVDPLEVELPEYQFEELPGDPDPLVVIRAIQCYGYQTFDDVSLELGEAYGFLSWLKSAALYRLTEGRDDLPLYIEDHNVFLRPNDPGQPS